MEIKYVHQQGDVRDQKQLSNWHSNLHEHSPNWEQRQRYLLDLGASTGEVYRIWFPDRWPDQMRQAEHQQYDSIRSKTKSASELMEEETLHCLTASQLLWSYGMIFGSSRWEMVWCVLQKIKWHAEGVPLQPTLTTKKIFVTMTQDFKRGVEYIVFLWRWRFNSREIKKEWENRVCVVCVFAIVECCDDTKNWNNSNLIWWTWWDNIFFGREGTGAKAKFKKWDEKEKTKVGWRPDKARKEKRRKVKKMKKRGRFIFYGKNTDGVTKMRVDLG